jgi:hypothetical protein
MMGHHERMISGDEFDCFHRGSRRALCVFSKPGVARHAISKAQFAAALSFHWNTGAIEKALWVELWKKGEVAAAKKAFMHWVTPPEIESRREKERDLFFDGTWSNDGTMTEYTRLTSKMTPVWSSARKIDVSKQLRAAFTSSAPIKLDVPMQPDAPVETPTLTPSASPSPKPGGAGAIVLIIILAAAIGAAFFLFNR